MANHKLSVTDNGTKTLLTAGKYCDRNIDVEVNVPKGLQPTKFTNILELDTTIVKEGYRVASGSYIETPDGVAIVFPVTAGTHKIRVRGPWIWPEHFYSLGAYDGYVWYSNFYESKETPTVDTFSGTLTYAKASRIGHFSQDEYGDFYFEPTVSKDCYIGFTLKNETIVNPNGTFRCEPILTLDEPIGYVEVT